MIRTEVKTIYGISKVSTIHLRTKKLLTPYIFPVINPFRKDLQFEDVKRVFSSNILTGVITNAYIILKNVGMEKIFNEKTTIHKLLNYDGIIMVDSGAYQILEYGKIEYNQPAIIKAMNILKPDIGVILDVPCRDITNSKLVSYSFYATVSQVYSSLRLISSEITWVLPLQYGLRKDCSIGS